MGNKGENIGDGGGWSRRFGPTMPHIRSAGGQNLQRPGGQVFGGLGRDGGEAEQRFPYLIFLDIAGHSQIPGSHTFCLPLFVVCVALLFAFVDGG